MTILPLDAAGLATAATALRRGEAAVIPLPTPLPYAVVATSAAAVNAAKGRPDDQPCGILCADLAELGQQLDLDRATAELAVWICGVERANLFAPIRHGAPDWLRAGTVDGLAGIAAAWLPQARPLAREFGHLAISSANLTGGPVAVTADAADSVFGGRRLVLDGQPFRDDSSAHGSATIVEVGPSGALRVARSGINDRAFPAAEAYLDELRRRYAEASA